MGKECRSVNIQKKKIFMKKILIVFYCVHFFYWSSFRKNFILMSLFLIFSNKIFMKKIIVVLQLQFLLISISCSFLIKKHFAARHGLGNGYLLGSILLTRLLGNSGGVVNSLDFCPALLKSLGCFYFWCVLPSEWKAVTVNLWSLLCQL